MSGASMTQFCDALADEVLQNIHNREALINRLEKLHHESVVSRDTRIQRLLYGIHNASLAVVEAITAWNQCKQQTWYRKKTFELHDATSTPADGNREHVSQRCPFNIFSWNGQNYMKKMLSDLDFVAEIPEALQFLGPTTSFQRNPFLLPMNVDELALCHRDKSNQSTVESRKISTIPWKDVKVQRVQHSSFIMLLDEFHRELGSLSNSLPDIDENDSLSAAYATSRCRDEMYSTRFYPPELNVEDLSDIANTLDPPATHVIAICCASLILNCVDADIMNKLLFLTKPIALKIFRQPLGSLIDKARSYNPLQKFDVKVTNIVHPFVMHEKMSKDAMTGTPESILLLTAWLRGVLARTYDADSVTSRSCSVDKVFSELNSANSRRNAKAGGMNKPTTYLSDDSNKENDVHCRNASVQVQTEDFDQIVIQEKDASFDKLQSFNGLFDPEPIRLVPIPIPITISVTEGSQAAVVNGDLEVASSIQLNDAVRICDPYESLDWKVKSAPCRDENGRVTFELTAAYDHSKIVAQEKKTRDDAIYRLCYGKDRTPSPGRALSSINLNEHHDVASDQQTSIRSHLHIKEVRVWKLITEDMDTRPPWRKEYDDEMIPWIEDYADSNKCAKLFRVRVKMKAVENSCRDSPYLNCVHQQRVTFFERVSLVKVIDEAFHAVCQWHPKGSLVDNVKWAKLSRKMKFMSNMKNAKHEIDMAFVRHNNDRKLDHARFHSILRDIASMQYPALHIDIALHKVVWASLVTLPDVNRMMWKEAKAMAITLETRRVCAQIRIATLVRKQHQRAKYAIAKSAAVVIETRVRSLLARALFASLVKARNDDATFKHQTQCSVVIQTSWRRYFWRNRFINHQEVRKAEARRRIAAVRAKLKAEKDRVAASIVYRDVIRIDSTIAAVAIHFHDESAFKEDAVLVMKVYVPTTKETFTFRLEEKTVRECFENALDSSSPLSWNEMLQVDALRELPKRLMLRVVRGRPIFLFSKKNIVEKGTLLKKVAILAAGDIFVLSLFRSPHEVAFVTYQPSTRLSMRTKLINSKLTEWLRDSSPRPGYQCDRTNSSTEGMLHLLNSTRQKELLDWLVKRVVIRKHPKEPHSMQLLLQFEAEEERILKLVTKVQSQWRRLRTQRRAKEQTFAQYEKIYNREYNMYAYRNVNTDERQWEKPKLLGVDDLANPVDEWREVQTEDGRKYYVNYGTGQSSWLSEQDAARLVQRRYRSKHESDLLGARIQFPDIVKAMKFIHGARVKYEQEPEKLSNLVNYAMLRHCLDLDFESAKPIYEKAMKQSPNHPLISRAYGIFLLASCQPTQAMSFQASTRLFREADVSDPHQTMIRSAAEIYFRWAVLGNAKNPLALLNYALLHQCIYKDYEHAEKIYRAALAIDPTNTFVTDNYSLFLQERYPGGAYESTGPPFSVVRRSKTIEERPKFGEWSKLIDPMCPKKGFEVYWYNRFTKVTQFAEPDWNEVWAVRVRRRSVVPDK